MKLIREDSAAAIPWAKSHGIDVIQIIYPGDTPHPDAYAHEVVASSKNEPYWAGVDPKAWAIAALAEVRRVKAFNLGKPILLPLVSYGARAGANGMDGVDYPGQYAYPNDTAGTRPYMQGAASWVKIVNAAAPALLGLVDGFSPHPYFNVPAFHVLDVVRAELTGLGHGQPFWLTEFGQYDTNTAASEQSAATIIQAQIAAVKARIDIAAAILYRLGENVENGSDHWGILRADGSQKPAYAAYKAAVQASP